MVPGKNKHTRGALNVVGSIANTLFGTATQDQIDHIHEKLQSFNQFAEEERKVFKVHSHILNVTLGNLTNVHQALDKLETATRMTENLFKKLNDKITETNQELLMLETLLHVQLALSVIFADHINLRIGLQTMMETHVSLHIITNTMLLKLLDDISVTTIGLLFPPKPEFLGLHRAAIRIVHKTALDGLSFLLIPLRGDPTDTFDVLRMDSLPFPIPHTNAFMLHYISKHYLVISESRTHYFFNE